MADPGARDLLLVVETAGAPKVVLHTPEGRAEVALKPVLGFRHHRAGAVSVGDVPAVPGSWLDVGGHRIAIDEAADAIELSYTEQGWEEGLVAVDPMPVVPWDQGTWAVPAVGWLSWGALALTLAVLAGGRQ